MREGITGSLLHDGYVLKYDFSIPLKDYYKLVHVMKDVLGKDAVRVCGYGHIGKYIAVINKYESL